MMASLLLLVGCTTNKPAEASVVNVPFEVAKNYFFKNGQTIPTSPKITAADGKNYLTQFYKLDAIISVGYRVNSIRATQFRQWCTAVLRQFAIRGYVIDKKRMENGAFISEDYFEYLLAEIREIRLSKRRFYQKLTDIYATAIDHHGSLQSPVLLSPAEENGPYKVIEDDHVIIIRDGERYDVTGVKLTK